MKIDIIYQNIDKLSETKEVEPIITPSMTDKQLSEILSSVRSIDRYTQSIERYVSNIKPTSSSKHDFTEDVYYYTSEIYDLLKKHF